MILLDRLASREDAKVRCKMCLCARWGSLIRDSICIDEGSSTTNATPPRRCQGGRDVPPRRVWLPYFSLLVDRDHRSSSSSPSQQPLSAPQPCDPFTTTSVVPDAAQPCVNTSTHSATTRLPTRRNHAIFSLSAPMCCSQHVPVPGCGVDDFP